MLAHIGYTLYLVGSHLYLVLTAPYYLYKMVRVDKYRAGFKQRFGWYPATIRSAFLNRQPVWIHAVSNGEVNAVTPLMKLIKETYPNIPILLSTVTDTGQQAAQKCPYADGTIYLPLDLPWVVKPVLNLFNPRAFILVETELWPCLLWELGRRRISTAMVNARLSDRSSRGYAKFAWFFRHVLDNFTIICARSEQDRKRYSRLGLSPEKLIVTGNLKYDALVPPTLTNLPPELTHRSLGLKHDDFVLVAGSTAVGEEEILLRVYLRMKNEFPTLRLIIAPRDKTRWETVARLIQDKTGQIHRRSSSLPPSDYNGVLLLDTMGELRFLYAFAQVAFIGKSLCGQGGQNPLEASNWGIPVIFGPHMQEFRQEQQLLIENQSALEVSDETSLELALRNLITDPDLCHRMGASAHACIDPNRGSAQRTLQLLVQNNIMQQI